MPRFFVLMVMFATQNTATTPRSDSILLEVCCDSLDSALAAERGGANRLELCAALEVGGTTPDMELVEEVCTSVRVPVHVMIRPRSGDFVYSSEEIHQMHRDIESCKSRGAAGVVFGIVHDDGRVHREHVRQLVDRAHRLSVTFHRAFDGVPDIDEAIDDLIDCGIDRILTSGSPTSIAFGIPTLGRCISYADAKIAIIAGGGVTFENVARIVAQSGVREVHVLRAVSRQVESNIGSESASRFIVEEERVRAMRALLDSIP